MAQRGDALLRLAYLLTGSRADAEDVVQDVLVRALPRWDRIRAADDVDAYVRRMVVNAHTSWWRRWRKRETPVEQVRDGAAAAAQPRDDDLWRACLALPADQRAAVVLRFYEDLSYAEIDDRGRPRGDRALAGLPRDRHAPHAGHDPGGRPMTDLETRLRDSLRSAAQDAPQATGLAARVRARRRPHRAAAAWTSGALVAAAVVLIAVVPLWGGGRVTPDTADERPTGDAAWQTLELSKEGDRLEIDVPGDWVRYDDPGCELDAPAGPPDVDPCVQGPLALFSSDLVDPVGPVGGLTSGQGFRVGYARAGDTVVQVAVRDEDEARRILASVRLEGETDPELEDWRLETLSDEYGEITVRVPEDPRVEVRLAEGLLDCDPGRAPAEPDGGGGWVASLCRDRIVTVTAPTQALADVVAATVEGY